MDTTILVIAIILVLIGFGGGGYLLNSYRNDNDSPTGDKKGDARSKKRPRKPSPQVHTAHH